MIYIQIEKVDGKSKDNENQNDSFSKMIFNGELSFFLFHLRMKIMDKYESISKNNQREILH